MDGRYALTDFEKKILILSMVMLAISLMLVGYANGVADTALRYQQEMEAANG